MNLHSFFPFNVYPTWPEHRLKVKKSIPSYSQCILNIILIEAKPDLVGLLGTKAFLCPLP